MEIVSHCIPFIIKIESFAFIICLIEGRRQRKLKNKLRETPKK
jgi:hypothetical protein